jgi:hypothetical protein
MKRHLLTAALLYAQLLSAAALGNGNAAKSASCAALLPPEAKVKLESAHKGWSVLEYDQLYPHQQEIWSARCPGVAVGQFRGPGTIGYAVVVVRQAGDVKQAKLVLLEKQKTSYAIQLLREQGEVPSYPVVHKEPPGVYREFYDRESTVKVVNDVFVYEHLEATATLFYYKDGKYQELLISD